MPRAGKSSPHAPVLPERAVGILGLRPGAVACDFTAGYGGHAQRILAGVGEGGRLVAFDRDPAAAGWCRGLFGENRNVSVVQANFGDAKAELARLGITQIDAALADLGVSSAQLDDASRGFSFHEDGPLDMRMGPDARLTAAEYLRQTPLPELVRAFKAYGEIKRPAAAAALKRYAQGEASPTTRGAAAVVVEHTPPRERVGKHPARLYFQALRIAVNGELAALAALLDDVPGMLRPGGVFAVIAFHSLEAALVKRRFRALCAKPYLPGVPKDLPAPFVSLTPKPVRPDALETQTNRRARSAELMAVQKAKDE